MKALIIITALLAISMPAIYALGYKQGVEHQYIQTQQAIEQAQKWKSNSERWEKLAADCVVKAITDEH